MASVSVSKGPFRRAKDANGRLFEAERPEPGRLFEIVPSNLRNHSEMVTAIEATGLLSKQDRVLVMLSGGADSVCLLDIAVQLCDHVEALHVNYGLRGDESDQDEHACRTLTDALGVVLHVSKVELSAQGNLHAQARDARYAVAERIRAKQGLDLIAVAHTRDDQVETLLYRLATSPGRRALRGMVVRRGQVVRPLIACSAAQVRDYLRARDIGWREDSSNTDERFVRARIRSKLVPQLRNLHPAAEQNLLETAQQLSDEGDLIDGLVNELVAKCAGPGGFDLSQLRSVPRALARLALRELIEGWAGHPVSVSDEVVTSLIDQPANGTRKLELPGIKLIREYDTLRPQTEEHAAALAQPLSLASVDWGDWTIGIGEPPSDRVGSKIFVEQLAPVDGLCLRARRPGDKIDPIGMTGSKSLQDLFVDRKVPRVARDRYPVVCQGEQVVWVPGLAVSRRFVAGPGDSSVSVWATPAR